MNTPRISLNLSGAAMVVVAFLAFFAVNLIAQQVVSNYRIDLTENRLYTLSDGTRSILENLDEPIVLSFFVTRSALLDFPGFNTYVDRVEEVLFEYERLSGGTVSIRVVEPEPFSEAEDLAVGHGLTRIPTADGSAAYLGLVGTNSVDDVRSISLFLPEREELLEYDLTRLVYQLDGKERKTVGIVSALPIQGTGAAPGQDAASQQPPWSFLIQLDSLFDLELISTRDEVLPGNLDMLVLIHPKSLPERLLYEIDQFALGGKSVLIFVDPFSEILAAMLGGSETVPGINTGADVNELTRNWGVTLRENRIVADLPIAARVLEGDGSSGKVIDYPVWMNVQPEQLSDDDPITSQLGNVIMATAGVLDLHQDAGLDIQQLVTTSPASTLYDYEEFSTVTDIRQLLENYEESGEQMVMAARISGRADTAFPQGPPESTDESTEPKPQIMDGMINAVIVADTDLLHDRFWIQQQQVLGQTVALATASNGDLIHNAVDNLSGDSSLIGIRGRGGHFRPFHRINEIRQDAERQFLAHESRLLEELDRVESLLGSFEVPSEGEGSERILTDEQRAELKQMRSTQLEIRKQLRDVQHRLGQDIERLETMLVVANVTLVPILVMLVGMYTGLIGWKRRDRKLRLQVSKRLKTG